MNQIRFHEKQPEIRVVRSDWKGPGGNIAEKIYHGTTDTKIIIN